MTGKDAPMDPTVTIQIFADQTWKIVATKDADPLLVSAVIANMNNNLQDEIKYFECEDPKNYNKLREREMFGSYYLRSGKDFATRQMSGLGALFG